MRRLSACAVVILLLCVGVEGATTGQLAGVVTDGRGDPLPGVTAVLTSDVLIGGEQVQVTDASGGFLFALLPPGVYRVRTDLPGFQPVEVETRVSLNRTTTVRIPMSETQFEAEIEVRDVAPVVNTTQVDTSQIFDQEYLKRATVGAGGRDYLSVIGNAAGVAGTANVSVYGSLGSENVYLVDGLNTTDPVTATFGTNFNFDAIQEVSFLTGGYEAEFGQATGGIVNLVTKSGGNEFSGTFDVRYRDSSFYESGDHFDPDVNDSKFQDLSATLGGPVVRDRLWFFVSVENVLSKSTPAYSQVGGFQPGTRTYDGWNYIGKLTWQMTDDLRGIFKISGDPATIDNIDTGAYTSPEADARQKQGGDIYQAEVNAVLSDAALLTAQVGVNRANLEAGPMSDDLDTSGYIDVWTGVSSINYFNYQDSNRDRDQARLTFTYFVNELVGAHELKAGVEYNKISFDSRNFYTGNRAFQVFTIDDDLPIPSYDEDGDGLMDYQMFVEYPLETARDWRNSTGEMWTGFIQDAWRPLPNLTVKPGVRYETIDFVNTADEDVATLDRWQPRLGVAWDIAGNAKSVLRASWGRFMHPSALGLPDNYPGIVDGTDIWQGYEYWCGVENVCNHLVLQLRFGDPYIHVDQFGNEHAYYFNERFGGGEPNRTIEQLGLGNIDGPYAEELILAFEQQLMQNTSIELSWVDKKTRALFGDTCLNNTWMLFGEGEPFDYGDRSTWTPAASCNDFAVANIPFMLRDYTGYILKLESREAAWLHLLASYTWSESKGSTDEDPAGGYDEPDWDVFPLTFYNKYGYMADDRRHRVKVSGYVLLPLDFTIGFDGYYQSEGNYTVTADCTTVLQASQQALDDAGITADQVEYCAHGQRWNTSIFLEPRGSSRGDADYRLDLQVSKGFQLGDIRLEGIFTVLNVFSNEIPYVYASDALSATAVGTRLAWTTPRRYEVGLRIEF